MIRSLEGWKALPELSIKAIPSEAAAGSVYTVVKVGFFAAAAKDVDYEIPQAAELPHARVALPTALIEVEEGSKLYRLPVELASWAVDLVALAHAGDNVFPEQVEFGLLPSGYYAEIL